MTDTRRFIESFRDALNDRMVDVAIANGRATDRTIDQYRMHAGRVAGMNEAMTLLDETLKKLTEDDV